MTASNERQQCRRHRRGITNGEELLIKIHMKPLSSLMRPLRSVDIKTMEPADAAEYRSDTLRRARRRMHPKAMSCSGLLQSRDGKIQSDSLPQTLSNYQITQTSRASFFKTKRYRNDHPTIVSSDPVFTKRPKPHRGCRLLEELVPGHAPRHVCRLPVSASPPPQSSRRQIARHRHRSTARCQATHRHDQPGSSK